MKRRAARTLRHLADHLDPKPANWYQVGTTSAVNFTMVHSDATDYWYNAQPKRTRPRRRVLADYLTAIDLKKLRP